MTTGQKVAAIAAVVVAIPLAITLLGVVAPAPPEEPSAETPSSPSTPPPEARTPSESPTPDECEQYDDVTSGEPLCDYRDAASYQYRLQLARNIDDTLPTVQQIAPWTEAQDLNDLYDTCDDLTRGLPAESITENAVTRFSGAPDEQVTPDEADRLVQIAQQQVCPASPRP